MSTVRFFEIELDQLLGEFEKITLFTKHPGTLGNYREHVLKSYIRKFLPGAVKVGSGFVCSIGSSIGNDVYIEQTKQIDCLVYDDITYTPFLGSEDFVIVDPRSVMAAIEIKSSLTFNKKFNKEAISSNVEYPFFDRMRNQHYRWEGTLVDALQNIKSIFDVAGNQNKRYFRGIFSYSAKFDFSALVLALDNGEIQKQLNIGHLDELPTYICIPDGTLVYFARVGMNERESDGFDETQSTITIIESVPENKAFPLRFFSSSLKAEVDNFLTKRMPDVSGIFSAGFGKVKISSHHFDLNSEYINPKPSTGN